MPLKAHPATSAHGPLNNNRPAHISSPRITSNQPLHRPDSLFSSPPSPPRQTRQPDATTFDALCTQLSNLTNPTSERLQSLLDAARDAAPDVGGRLAFVTYELSMTPEEAQDFSDELQLLRHNLPPISPTHILTTHALLRQHPEHQASLLGTDPGFFLDYYQTLFDSHATIGISQEPEVIYRLAVTATELHERHTPKEVGETECLLQDLAVILRGLRDIQSVAQAHGDGEVAEALGTLREAIRIVGVDEEEEGRGRRR